MKVHIRLQARKLPERGTDVRAETLSHNMTSLREIESTAKESGKDRAPQ